MSEPTREISLELLRLCADDLRSVNYALADMLFAEIEDPSQPSIRISTLLKESHATAVEKGWWDNPRNFSELIALIHSEVSETLEAWRDGDDGKDVRYSVHFDEAKPDGTAIEFADILIRVFDACAGFGIPIENALRVKMAYNKTRPHRHGGKRA